MLCYLANLNRSRIILWCYLCWYLTIVTLHFELRPGLWISSLGMSAIIGTALVLSTTSNLFRPDKWAVFRLYVMPLCVSSYSALIVGKGFILVFPPHLSENLLGLAMCALFLLLQRLCKLSVPKQTQ